MAANRYNGAWLVLPKVNFEILCEILENENLENALVSLEEPERQYVLQLLDELLKMRVVTKSNTERNVGLKTITLAITNECNLHCRHCCQNAGAPGDNEQASTELLKERIRRIMKLRPEYLSITGGEPLIRGDFIEICNYVKDLYSGKLILMTNGTLLNDKNMNEIVKIFDSVDISLDGVDEASCSLIRGKNVFTRVMQNVRLLKGKGMQDISLSMVMTKQNEGLKDRFKQLNKELGTSGVLRPLSHSGRAEESEDLFPQEHDNYKMLGCEDRNLQEIRKSIRCRTCPAVYRSLYIESDGGIYPCGALNHIKYCLGNLDSWNGIGDLYGTILNKSLGFGEFLAIHPENQNKCEKCPVSMFCFNCLASYKEEKSKKYFESLCVSRRKLLQKIVWD